MVNRNYMLAAEAYRRLNRHGASSILSILLLGIVGFTDFMAWTRMELCQRQFLLMDSRAIHEIAVIDFIHAHIWLVCGYIVLFLASLLWLEVRSASRWIVWLTFVLFAVPSVIYGAACAHISNKFIAWGFPTG